MSPEKAFERLLLSGPFDDPDFVHYPYRWYFDAKGVLSCCAWKSPYPRKFPQFTRPSAGIIKTKQENKK